MATLTNQGAPGIGLFQNTSSMVWRYQSHMLSGRKAVVLEKIIFGFIHLLLQIS
jgi:hypothetical protein